MSQGKCTVLFLCSGNVCRSQMAEAFLKKYAGDRFNVYSAGLEPSDIHPLTRKVMAEVGLDMRGQRSKSVAEYFGRSPVRFLIVVCAQANKSCPTTWPGSPKMQKIFWPFEDPVAFEGPEDRKLAKFREVRDQIDSRIKAWLAEETPDLNPEKKG